MITRTLFIAVHFAVCFTWIDAWIALGNSSDTEAVKITAHVSSREIRVAEPVEFEVRVTAPSGSKVIFPVVTSQLSNFEVVHHLDRFDIPSTRSVSERTWTRKLTLESLQPGEMTLSSIEVQVVGPQVTQALRTEPLLVRVLSVLPEGANPQDFRDIQSVVDVAVPETPSRVWFWWSVGVLLACFFSIVAVIKIRPLLAPTPPVWALREIATLENSASFLSADAVAVFQQLTTILRRYIELQFNIPAQAQTTDELTRVITAENILNDAHVKLFSKLATTADEVKFGQQRSTRAELATAIDDARQWIGKTAAESRLRNSVTSRTGAH
jgi:hypothetical protein